MVTLLPVPLAPVAEKIYAKVQPTVVDIGLEPPREPMVGLLLGENTKAKPAIMVEQVSHTRPVQAIEVDIDVGPLGEPREVSVDCMTFPQHIQATSALLEQLADPMEVIYIYIALLEQTQAALALMVVLVNRTLPMRATEADIDLKPRVEPVNCGPRGLRS